MAMAATAVPSLTKVVRASIVAYNKTKGQERKECKGKGGLTNRKERGK